MSDSHQCALNLWRVKCYVYFLVFVTENLLPGNRECTLTNSIPELFFDNYDIYYLRHGKENVVRHGLFKITFTVPLCRRVA